MRGSSSSSISASQDHLSQFHNSPNHTHSGYNHTTTAMNRLNIQHQTGTLPPGSVPPPPIKQRSFVHRRTNSGNSHDASPSNHGIAHTAIRPSGFHSGTSPPYVNASAAEVDLLNNSFGSDRGSNGGQTPGLRQAKYHHTSPRHAPKQPPPPVPTNHGGIQLTHPPYIPPPKPRGSMLSDNFTKKLPNEQIGASRPGANTQYSYQPPGEDAITEVFDEDGQNARYYLNHVSKCKQIWP